MSVAIWCAYCAGRHTDQPPHPLCDCPWATAWRRNLLIETARHHDQYTWCGCVPDCTTRRVS